MKTYPDFVEFIEQPKYLGVVWEYVKSEAVKNGFKKWQVWLYARFYRRKRIKLKQIFKKNLKICCYVFAVMGLIMFTWDVRKLIKSTTAKNILQSVESVIHICEDVPAGCEQATNILRSI